MAKPTHATGHWTQTERWLPGALRDEADAATVLGTALAADCAQRRERSRVYVACLRRDTGAAARTARRAGEKGLAVVRL